MNKTVVIFAAYFPPRRRVGAIRPYRFAVYLKKMGWNVHVITIQDQKNELTDDEINALEGINIFEIETPIDRTQTKPTVNKSKSSSKGLSGFIDDIFPLDTWLPLYWKKQNDIEKYIQDVSPDIIWSTSDPWSTNHIAGKIAKKFNIPWIADFRDPWTLCSVRYSNRKWPATHFDEKAEKWILHQADHVTFTAKSTELKYVKEYPGIEGKTSTITNSFEYSKENSKNDQSIDLESSKLNVLFLGKFRTLSNAEAILKVLGFIDKDLRNDISVYSFAELLDSDRDAAQKLDVLSSFKTLESVPFEEVNALANQFDLMLLSTHPERDDIIPAKLFDYLKAEKPILSLAPNPEVGEIVSNTNSGKHFNLHEFKSAADFLSTLIDQKKTDGLKAFNDQLSINKEEVNKFEISSTSANLAALFNQILQNG